MEFKIIFFIIACINAINFKYIWMNRIKECSNRTFILIQFDKQLTTNQTFIFHKSLKIYIKKEEQIQDVYPSFPGISFIIFSQLNDSTYEADKICICVNSTSFFFETKLYVEAIGDEFNGDNPQKPLIYTSYNLIQNSSKEIINSLLERSSNINDSIEGFLSFLKIIGLISIISNLPQVFGLMLFLNFTLPYSVYELLRYIVGIFTFLQFPLPYDYTDQDIRYPNMFGYKHDYIQNGNYNIKFKINGFSPLFLITSYQLHLMLFLTLVINIFIRNLHNHQKYFQNYLEEKYETIVNLEMVIKFILRNNFFCNFIIYYNNLLFEANLLYFWIGICLTFKFSGQILKAEQIQNLIYQNSAICVLSFLMALLYFIIKIILLIHKLKEIQQFQSQYQYMKQLLDQEKVKENREKLSRAQIILEQSLYGTTFYFFKNKNYQSKARAYLILITNESKFLAAFTIVFFCEFQYAQTILLLLIEISMICYRVILRPEKFFFLNLFSIVENVLIFILLCSSLKNENKYENLKNEMIVSQKQIDEWLDQGNVTFTIIIILSIVPFVKLYFRTFYNYVTIKLYLKSNKLAFSKIIELDFYDYDGCIYFQQKFFQTQLTFKQQNNNIDLKKQKKHNNDNQKDNENRNNNFVDYLQYHGNITEENYQVFSNENIEQLLEGKAKNLNKSDQEVLNDDSFKHFRKDQSIEYIKSVSNQIFTTQDELLRRRTFYKRTETIHQIQMNLKSHDNQQLKFTLTDVLNLRVPYNKKKQQMFINFASKNYLQIATLKEALAITQLFQNVKFIMKDMIVNVVFHLHQKQTISIFQNYYVGEYRLLFNAENLINLNYQINMRCKLNKQPLIEEENEFTIFPNQVAQKNLQFYPISLSDNSDQLLMILIAYCNISDQRIRTSEDSLAIMALDCSYIKLIQCDQLLKPQKMQRILQKLYTMKQLYSQENILIDKKKLKFYRIHSQGYAMTTQTLSDKKMFVLCSQYSVNLDENQSTNQFKFYLTLNVVVDTSESAINVSYDQNLYSEPQKLTQHLIKEYVERLIVFLTICKFNFLLFDSNKVNCQKSSQKFNQ